MIEIGLRLKEARTQLKMTQKEFSTIAGVTDAAQVNYEKGNRKPDTQYLSNIAKLGCDIQYIITGVKANNPDPIVYDNAGNLVDLDEFCFVPRYDVCASAGNGSAINAETYVFSMAYRKYWVEKYLQVNYKNLIAITARGDSMIGLIEDRDVMLVDTANKTPREGIYVIRLDGDLIVKSVQKLPGNIIEISSTNPLYKPFQVNMDDVPNDFEIIGAVVHTEPGTLLRNRRTIRD